MTEEEAISELAANIMAASGLGAVPLVPFYVSIITINMHNPETQQGVGGAVFGGVYSTHERAAAATRGIAEGIIRENKDAYEHIEVENSIIETYVDVIPKQGMHELAEMHEEEIDPEDLT